MVTDLGIELGKLVYWNRDRSDGAAVGIVLHGRRDRGFRISLPGLRGLHSARIPAAASGRPLAAATSSPNRRQVGSLSA
jgi:hypothetical protein